MPLTFLAALDPWADLSDEQVVAEVLAGHTATFEALMRRHNQRLYRTAGRFSATRRRPRT